VYELHAISALFLPQIKRYAWSREGRHYIDVVNTWGDRSDVIDVRQSFSTCPPPHFQFRCGATVQCGRLQLPENERTNMSVRSEGMQSCVLLAPAQTSFAMSVINFWSTNSYRFLERSLLYTRCIGKLAESKYRSIKQRSIGLHV